MTCLLQIGCKWTTVQAKLDALTKVNEKKYINKKNITNEQLTTIQAKLDALTKVIKVIDKYTFIV